MRLDEFLKEKKISQKAFGGLLSPPVAQTLVSQWIHGATRVTLDYALQIESVTKREVTPGELLSMYVGRHRDDDDRAAA